MAENDGKSMIPPISRVHYKSGEMVAKEGDYGIAVYKILKGGLEVYSDTEGHEILLETLKPGQLFGEENFVFQGAAPYPASVRANQDTELEIWHVTRLRREYDSLPPFLRLIIEQPMKRLVRSRKLLLRYESSKNRQAVREAKPLVKAAVQKIIPAEKKPAPEQTVEKKPGAEKPPVEETKPVQSDEAAAQAAEDEKENWAAQQRRYYRKEMNQEIEYFPSGKNLKIGLKAHLKDISRGGIGMEITGVNLRNHSHDPGDKFSFDISLPDGAAIQFVAQIAHVKNTKTKGIFFAGLSISDIGYESQKKLGFFLMP